MSGGVIVTGSVILMILLWHGLSALVLWFAFHLDVAKLAAHHHCEKERLLMIAHGKISTTDHTDKQKGKK